MDVDRLLNFEKRTGIKDDDIEDFIRKATEVEAAVQGLRDGTVNPDKIKIEGIDSEEEKQQKEKERQQRLEQQRIQTEQLRIQRKAEERERWWAGSEYFVLNREVDDKTSVSGDDKIESSKSAKLLQRYTLDYSRWNEWVPADPVTLEEERIRTEEEERIKNEEFEKNNAEFCTQFMVDHEERSKSIQKKQESADSHRIKGNLHFKRKEYVFALDKYMEALKLLPYEGKTLLNIAQVHIKVKDWEDAEEFLKRSLQIDPLHVKALSRYTFVLCETNRTEEALVMINKALSIDPINVELQTQQKDVMVLAAEAKDEQELRALTASLTLQGTTRVSSNKTNQTQHTTASTDSNSVKTLTTEKAKSSSGPETVDNPSVAVTNENLVPGSSTCASSSGSRSMGDTTASSSSSSSTDLHSHPTSSTSASATPTTASAKLSVKERRVAAGLEVIDWFKSELQNASDNINSIPPATSTTSTSTAASRYPSVMPSESDTKLPSSSWSVVTRAIASGKIKSAHRHGRYAVDHGTTSTTNSTSASDGAASTIATGNGSGDVCTIFEVCYELLSCQNEKAFKVYFRTSGALTALLQYAKQLFELFAADLTATISPSGAAYPVNNPHHTLSIFPQHIFAHHEYIL